MPHITHRRASAILSKATGFIRAFDYTLNPYSGCAFACHYCYAAFFAPTQHQQDRWGEWVQVKANALELLQKKRRRPLVNCSIYMSSVTDPYQPIERRLELTRALLKELVEHHQVRLVIQTRSPLITRDVDLLRRFPYARVNMTVTTDDEDVRKAFEPMCPSNEQRLSAISAVAAAGIETCITLTPLLPLRDPAAFAQRLLATGVGRFVVQDFHATRSRFVAGTGEAARRLLQARGWGAREYAAARQALQAVLPALTEGQDGFRPE
jgi:DNA repair photolyase